MGIFSFFLNVMMMGRWSEFKALSVWQVRLADIMVSAVVMSGEMGCWFGLNGSRVGVFWLRMMWFELRMSEVMSWSLWSVKGQCHVCEWALKSPVIMELGRLVRWMKRLVIKLSMLVLGGM